MMWCLLLSTSITTHGQSLWLEKGMACLSVEQWFRELACALYDDEVQQLRHF